MVVTFSSSIRVLWKQNSPCFEGTFCFVAFLSDKVRCVVTFGLLTFVQGIPTAAILRNWQEVPFSSFFRP